MRDAQITGYTPKAIAGVTPEERIMVASRAVACDGGNGALGHPRVWLRIEAEQVTCPYCSRSYALKPGTGDDGHH